MPNRSHPHDSQGRHGITIHRSPSDIPVRRVEGTCLFILTPNEKLDSFLNRIVHLIGTGRNGDQRQDKYKTSGQRTHRKLILRRFGSRLTSLPITDGGEVGFNSLAIGLVTILGGFVGRRYSHRYFLIVAVACGYAAGLLVSFIWPQPLTELEYLGRMPLEWLPINIPTVNIEYLMTSIQLIPYAVTIAFIGLAQSLVIVRELKMTTDQAIDLDKEVYAQGMANFLAPFFSTFAGSGSFNRSKANRSLGASTPLSGIVAAGFVLLLITFLGPILTYMPMAAMAGTLFIVGLDMIKWSDVKHFAPEKTELATYLATFIGILFFGLATGIAIAVLLSVSVFLLRISQLELAEEPHKHGSLLKIKGSLFYASVAHLTEKFRRLRERDLTIDLQYTTHIDQSAVDFFSHEAQTMLERDSRLTLIVNSKQRNFLVGLGLHDSVKLLSVTEAEVREHQRIGK